MNRHWATRFASDTPHPVTHLLTHDFGGFHGPVQVHVAVLLTLIDNPHAVGASCLGLAAPYLASLPYADTQWIEAGEREDQGNGRSIEDLFQIHLRQGR